MWMTIEEHTPQYSNVIMHDEHAECVVCYSNYNYKMHNGSPHGSAAVLRVETCASVKMGSQL